MEPSSPPPLGLLADQSNVAALVEAEKLGSSLQLEMLEMERRSDEILNGLRNHIGFMLLYAMGGLELQSKASCWIGIVIMVAVTINFIVGMVLGVKFAKLKLKGMEIRVNELDNRKKLLTEVAKKIGDLESLRINRRGQEGQGEQNVMLGMVRAQSVVSRAAMLENSRDMSSFAGTNRAMIRYIICCGIVYLAIITIFLLFKNCGNLARKPLYHLLKILYQASRFVSPQ
ncbi:hypothetical protein RND71_018740 [Anisodus tanguticus]|uniref:Uncharacterized protein n=1 Tax=Anisodus tanguticus TaxID=243964 RepID=A0AAE1S5Y4_9SOLA|nr:hypothetical protein RND71_018740 [Anisodus tanguticus]